MGTFIPRRNTVAPRKRNGEPVEQEDKKCSNTIEAKVEDARPSLVSIPDLRELLDSQQVMCALCGCELTPRIAELDHIKPRANGGTDAISNLQWLCKVCNRMKGAMSQDEFLAVCCRVSQRIAGPSGQTI